MKFSGHAKLSLKATHVTQMIKVNCAVEERDLPCKDSKRCGCHRLGFSTNAIGQAHPAGARIAGMTTSGAMQPGFTGNRTFCGTLARLRRRGKLMIIHDKQSKSGESVKGQATDG